MLQGAGRTKINGHSVSFNTVGITGHVTSLAVVVRMYREILNVDGAFGIFPNKDKNTCIVIGRSSSDGLNIGDIMRNMGGGGHPGAGSVMLKGAEPETVEQIIRDLIEGGQKSSVQISDLMSFPVFSINASSSMEEAAKLLRKKGCTGVPVLQDQKLVGIISRRDFRKIKKESHVMTIDAHKSPMHAAQIMVKHDVGRLPVVEDGRIIGIVTRSDTMLYFYDMLPD